MSQKENVEKLLKLIQQYPDVEIVPMIDCEAVPSDDYSSWAGSWGFASLDEYYRGDERIYFRSEDEEQLIDDEYEDFCGKGMNDDEVMEKAREKVNAYPWTKCICVYIGPA